MGKKKRKANGKIPSMNVYCSPYGDHAIPNDIYNTIEFEEPPKGLTALLNPDQSIRQPKLYPENIEFWHWLTGKDLEARDG